MQKIIVRVGVREDGTVLLVGSNAPDGLEIEIVTVSVNTLPSGRATMPVSELIAAPTIVPPAPDASLPTIEQIRDMSDEELNRLLNHVTVEGFYQLCAAGFDVEHELMRRKVLGVSIERKYDFMYLTGEAFLEARAERGDELLGSSPGNVWHWLWARFYRPGHPLPTNRLNDLLQAGSVYSVGRVARLLRIARHQSLTMTQSLELRERAREHGVHGVVLDMTGAVIVDETIRANTSGPNAPICLPPGATILSINDFWEKLHIYGA